MKNIVFSVSLLALLGCQNVQPINEASPSSKADSFVDLSQREKPDPVVTGGWQSVVIGAPDMYEFSRLFIEIGDYEVIREDDRFLTIRAKNTQDGYIQIYEVDHPDSEPARPLDATAWDTGCYWSVMMRAKNIPSIIEDARALGWEPHTEMAYLEFGPSKLNIVVLRHQVTGAQVQLYERLTTPLPEGFPEFERISRPFNIMQMVKDRDEAYDFFQQRLGFETFYYGKPYLSPEPAIMPLGIPEELTTKVPYKAAIVYPEVGMEWGRFEMIEIDGENYGLKGRDFSDRCNYKNFGITSVHYGMSIEQYDRFLKLDDQADYFERYYLGPMHAATIKSPDGALIVLTEPRNRGDLAKPKKK